MAVPKRRTSHSKTRSGRAHHAMTPPKVVYCPNCAKATLPHRVCASCGYFHGRQVFDEKEG